MMPFRQLAKVESLVLISMLLVAVAVGTYLAADVIRQPSDLLKPANAFAAGFLATFAFGSIPAFFFGAPFYLILFQRGRASWLASMALGVALSSPLFLMSWQVGILAISCGAVVAAFTHAASSRWLNPNNSFKPKPLRGSA